MVPDGPLAPDGGPAARPLPLADLATVTLSQLYCGAVSSSCGGAWGFGPRVDYTIDLAASTLTTKRCQQGDGGPAQRPETTRPLTATQLRALHAALAEVRVVDAEITALDGPMQALALTSTSGTTTRYSPGAACGPRNYQKVVEGFGALWKLVESFDPG